KNNFITERSQNLKTINSNVPVLMGINSLKRKTLPVKKSFNDGWWKKIFRNSFDIELITNQYKKIMSMSTIFKLTEDTSKLKDILLTDDQFILFKLLNPDDTMRRTLEINAESVQNSFNAVSVEEHKDKTSK